jgi:hypothetical protein
MKQLFILFLCFVALETTRCQSKLSWIDVNDIYSLKGDAVIFHHPVKIGSYYFNAGKDSMWIEKPLGTFLTRIDTLKTGPKIDTSLLVTVWAAKTSGKAVINYNNIKNIPVWDSTYIYGIISGKIKYSDTTKVVVTLKQLKDSLSKITSVIKVVNSSCLFSKTPLAGSNVTTATFSNFFGDGAGSGATGASHSNFMGYYSGSGATSAPYSNFLGLYCGMGATSASYSNFLGYYAGNGATKATGSNFLGYYAGIYATGAAYSNFLGYSAGNGATSASNSNFLGYGAGGSATSASYANFIGYSAGTSATSASNSNFIGVMAGTSATSANNSNFLGANAGCNATNAKGSNFLGASAGNGATGAAYSNIFGYNAGSSGAKYSSYSNLFGYNAGKTISGDTLGSNNIIIGTNLTLANATANAMNIGGVLFGSGFYSVTSGNPSATAVSTGKIGIGIVSPTCTLDVNGETKATKFTLSSIQTAPESATSSGSAGEIRFCSDGIYLCVTTNTWLKCAASSF